MKSRLIFTALLIALYVTIFISVNERSSDNPDMLVCSGLDEFALYPHLLRMIFNFTQGRWLDFFDHGQYSYGYLHYFISFLSVIPTYLKQGFGAVWTKEDIVILRELSPLFYSIGCAALSLAWGNGRGLWYSISLLVFLLMIPAAVFNSTWWHPDSLQFMAVVGGLTLLGADNYRLGRYFYLSAIPIGISITVKTLGVIFIPISILYVAISCRHNKEAATCLRKKCAFFAFYLCASIAISYPSLFIPGVIDGILKFAAEESFRQSIGTLSESRILRPISYWNDVVSQQYFGFLFASIIIAGILFAVKGHRTLSSLALVTLLWSGVHIFVVVFFLKKEQHYLLPSLVPLIPFAWQLIVNAKNIRYGRFLYSLVILIVAIQAYKNLKKDISYYETVKTETADCWQLKSYKNMADLGLLYGGEGRPIKILHEVGVYIERSPSRLIYWQWDPISYSLLEQIQPDVLIIKNRTYAGNFILGQDTDAVEGRSIYADATNDKIAGFNLAYRDRNISAFVFKR